MSYGTYGVTGVAMICGRYIDRGCRRRRMVPMVSLVLL